MIPDHVTLVEVGPRDGLQNEQQPVATAHKIELVQRLQAAGLREIEVTSYVSPKWVPQMADHAQVVAAAREAGLKVRSAISCALGCPYQGEVTPDEVEHLVKLFKQIGVHHCGVADTIGVGTPRKVQAVMERALKHYPLHEVSGHFHDTYGQALANIHACLQLGIHHFDTSVAGLGGCPYAKGATGNVATEDVVFMLQGMGIDTGIDLDALVDAGAYISDVLGRAPVSRVAKALLIKRGRVFA